MLANRSTLNLRRHRQMLLAMLLVLAPLSICSAKCRFLPQYLALQTSIEQLKPQEAALAVEQYARVNENPDPCELQEIDRQLSTLERVMFDLTTGNTTLTSQLVLRCSDIDLETLRCNGPREDRSQSPETLQIEPMRAPNIGRVSVAIKRAGTTLQVLYVSTLADMKEERPATRLTGRSNLVLLPKELKGKVLIGIFKTDGLWPYRKVLWYF